MNALVKQFLQEKLSFQIENWNQLTIFFAFYCRGDGWCCFFPIKSHSGSSIEIFHKDTFTRTPLLAIFLYSFFPRGGKVYTEIVPDCSRKTMQAIILGKLDPGKHHSIRLLARI